MTREELFQEHRPRLLAIAHRMLGSRAEADDAVQETWLRLSRVELDEIDNPGGWLTTVVARVCLNLLRTRDGRREEPFDAAVVPTAGPNAPLDPVDEAVLADEVGLAMLVILQTLSPAERLSFVLHDMFAVPFDDIAGIVGRTPTATRQLASRARRRVQETPAPTADLAAQRAAVDAFFAAARGGDFTGLLTVLDPEVELRAGGHVLRGATTVAGNAIRFADPRATLRPAVVNGHAGVVVLRAGRPFSVMWFTVAAGVIVAIDIEQDPARLRTVVGL